MATIAPDTLARIAGVTLLALTLTACGDSNVQTTCKSQIDATATARDLYAGVSECLKKGIADEAIRDDLKLRSEKLLKDGKVGAFASAMPPEPDVVEGVQNNVRRYSIRSLIQVTNLKPRVLHLGFEFTEGEVSGIVFDLNERQEADTKQPDTKK